ncbi:helix-turn-helix transcriptional regulator [Streptomyces incarnatus]
MVNRRELDPEASPAAAFGARMRRLREEQKWTQEELAEKLGYSSQHVSAVETARKPPTLRFSRKLDQVFGLASSTDTLERDWRQLRHSALLEGFPEYVKYEGQAAEIRLFQIGLIPGLLQTPEYARAVAEGDVRRGAITPEQADERVAFLANRQAALVRPRSPMVLVVMDESCLHHTVGGTEVMDHQLQRLVEVASLPNWVIHVSPFGIGARRSFDLPMYLLTMPDLSVVAYAESQLRGHVERETAAVLPLLTAYHQLQAEALPQAASVAMIHEVRKGTP